MIIFDCNGVLVDSESIVTSVTAEEFTKAGCPMTPQVVARFFTGRRPTDIVRDVEAATGRKLPVSFTLQWSNAILRRLRTDVCPTPHVAHALTWVRGLKCVASSAPIDRIRASLEAAGLLRFLEPHLFSGNDQKVGKPAPDLFLHAAAKMEVDPRSCIVVEDSPVGVAAAVAAGMTPIGFVGGTHAAAALPGQLTAAGARAVISDMRALKSTITALRGW